MVSKKLIILAVILVGIVILILSLLAILQHLFESGIYEGKRMTSPNGTTDAVVVNSGGGATDMPSCGLYIVPAGQKITTKNLKEFRYNYVFDATHYKDLNISWINDTTVEIQYSEARIQYYKNYVYPQYKTKPKLEINVKLKEISK